MDLSADEPESRSTQSKHGEQSSSSSSSSLSQSASTPFATYSSAEKDHSQQQQQVVPEFGMRNPPKTSSSSSSSTQQSDHQKAFANYAAEQAQLTFEPSISSAYKHSSSGSGSSSGVVTREFSPSVYRMSDSAATNHGELLNAHESDQTYGQATSISHEMDSPYYSKTTAVDGSGGAASGGENSNSGDNGGFTPISMSVDEAFRKYFPAQKQDQEGGEQQQQQQQNSGDAYGNSNQQQQQQQTPKSSTQYITTYASDDGENAQQVS